jgi:hypothetical protein
VARQWTQNTWAVLDLQWTMVDDSYLINGYMRPF